MAEEPPSARDEADGVERASAPDRGAADDSEASVATVRGGVRDRRLPRRADDGCSPAREPFALERARRGPEREPRARAPARASPPTRGESFLAPAPAFIGTVGVLQGRHPRHRSHARHRPRRRHRRRRDGHKYSPGTVSTTDGESDTDGSDDESDVSDTVSSDVSSDTSTEISDDTENEYDEEDDEADDDAREGDARGPGPARDFRAMVEARLRLAVGGTTTASEAYEEDIFGGSTAATTPTIRHARESHTDANTNARRDDANGSATVEDPFADAGARLGGGSSAEPYSVSPSPTRPRRTVQRLFGDEVDDDAFGGGVASRSNVAGESTRAAMDANTAGATARLFGDESARVDARPLLAATRPPRRLDDVRSRATGGVVASQDGGGGESTETRARVARRRRRRRRRRLRRRRRGQDGRRRRHALAESSRTTLASTVLRRPRRFVDVAAADRSVETRAETRADAGSRRGRRRGRRAAGRTVRATRTRFSVAKGEAPAERRARRGVGDEPQSRRSLRRRRGGPRGGCSRRRAARGGAAGRRDRRADCASRRAARATEGVDEESLRLGRFGRRRSLRRERSGAQTLRRTLRRRFVMS